MFFFIYIFLLVSCASDSYLYQKGVAVAVWDFDDLSPSLYAQADLGELLSSQVIETIQKSGNVKVIERERLIMALEELRLGTASFVDEATRLELGKMSGARLMVFGGYQIIGDQMRLDLRLVEVETGKIHKAVNKTVSATDLSGWLSSARQAAKELF